MLESYKGSIKKHKINFIKIESQNSYKELNDEDKNVITRKRRDKKKNKTMKVLKQLNLDNIEVKEKEKEKIKFSLGEIKIAKIHKKATKPLKQIKDLTKEDIKLNSCPCCGLPTKISGKLEDYKICDNPDEYTNCGEGVVLYFSFFKFCIIVLFIATLGISFFDSFISYYYYSKLKIFCDKLPIYEEGYTDYDDCLYDYKYAIYFCGIYSEEKRLKSVSYLKDHIFNGLLYLEHDPYTTLFDSFFFKTSLVNYNNYKHISEILGCKFENYIYKSTIINPNFVNFLWLIIIFIAYLIFIFFMYN